MRSTAALLFVAVTAACGGPTQQQILETPSARAPAVHSEAPAASTSDEDRSHLVQQFDDMNTTQNAYHEARQESKPPAKTTAKNGTPKKKGPAIQAPSPEKQPSPAPAAATR